MKFPRFLQHLPHFQRISRTQIVPDPANILRVEQQPPSVKLSAGLFVRLLVQCADRLVKQGARQLRNLLAYAATFFAPPALSLAEAVHVLEGIRQQPQTAETSTLQRKAFACLHHFLQQQPAALQTGPLQPLLMLTASCLARLPDIQQRSQALMLIDTALTHTPQLALAETLTMQLWGLSGALIPRAFDAIERFLQHDGDDPRLQIDILLELTDVMQIPSCRQRAKALVHDGLRRLATAPGLRRRIESRLALSDGGAARSQWHRFNS
jgi:hypothetical protein